MYPTSLLDGQFWSTLWGQLSIELFGGIAGAFIFLLLILIFLRPSIRIAGFLCQYNINGQQFFIFKFVNCSFFSAHEIKVELFKIRRIPMGAGAHNNEFEKLSIVNGSISHIPKRPFFWQKNLANPHCITVRSIEDISAILLDEMQAIIIKIHLKHGLTGLSRVFEQEFASPADVKMGKFRPGTKFAV
jgi:hypothetical protein